MREAGIEPAGRESNPHWRYQVPRPTFQTIGRNAPAEGATLYNSERT